MRCFAVMLVILVLLPLIATRRICWPQADGRYAGYPVDLPASLAVLQEEHKRTQQLEAKRARRQSQEEVIARLVNSLVSGHTSFSEAAHWVLASPTSQGLDCFRWARLGHERGDSDPERVCRRLLKLVDLHMADHHSDRPRIMARLEGEMTDFIANYSARHGTP
jgi:hypothetical protein